VRSGGGNGSSVLVGFRGSRGLSFGFSDLLVNAIIMGGACSPTSEVRRRGCFVHDAAKDVILESFLINFDSSTFVKPSEGIKPHEVDVVLVDRMGLLKVGKVESCGLFSTNVTKGGSKFGEEVWPGYRPGRDHRIGVWLPRAVFSKLLLSPCQGAAFLHIRKGEGDFRLVGVVIEG